MDSGRRKLIASLSPLLLVWRGKLAGTFLPEGSVVIRCRPLFVEGWYEHPCPTNVGVFFAHRIAVYR